MSSKPSFWRCVSGYLAFQKLPETRRRVVFYSEGKTYWQFLRPFVKTLLETTDETPTYVSSEADDPGLTFAPERMTGLTVGSGFMMILWFQSLRANVLAMTTPDLEVFHAKRSRSFPVHYAYLMHGADSVSMVLRERALDHFDSVFCAGPHNITEIRKREEMHKLPAKQLFEVGYPYQDELIERTQRELQNVTKQSDRLTVLVAPSWSEHAMGTLEVCGVELVGTLLDAGFETILRPHPRTRQLQPKCIEAIRKKYAAHPNFTLEQNTTNSDLLLRADILISDWSAIALEFAYARLRPVLYIDVPRKAMNPNYQELGLEPFEVGVRNKIGAIVSPSKIDTVPGLVRQLCCEQETMTEKIRAVRDANVFNVGTSALPGAKTLVQLANKLCPLPFPLTDSRS